MYEKAASAMRDAIKQGEVTSLAEREQLEAGARSYEARAAELRGSVTSSQLDSAMAAAKVAGTAQQATENAGGGKQMAGTAAAGAAAGMFVVGAIGFPIAGAVLGAGALAYAAGMRPEGDTGTKKIPPLALSRDADQSSGSKGLVRMRRARLK